MRDPCRGRDTPSAVQALVQALVQAPVREPVQAHAAGAATLTQFIGRLAGPGAIWRPVAAAAVDERIAERRPLLDAGDTLIDGGNSHYVDAIRRAQAEFHNRRLSALRWQLGGHGQEKASLG